MISTSFEYKRVSSVEEAIQALNDDSKLLAGGHSLIPALKLRLNQTGTLIDIGQIESLQEIAIDGSDLVIGAGSTHAQIAGSQDVKQHAPLLADVAGKIGDVQVRNAGTIGGSIAHADPAADWPAALLAASATVIVQGKSGGRSIAIEDFFTGIYSTDLAAGEIITAIRVPSMQTMKAAYEKFAQPASRFALVGCAVAAENNNGTLTRVKIAFTGLSDTPFCDQAAQQAIEGKELSDSIIADAVSRIDDSVYVMEDHYANEEYRRHLAGVMLSRALKKLA
ncbi:MAG: xanthine dehydrogenase family protein subunit M [Saprospiraceae bacterium]|nr:xanthine dehydrogenase family protein subunit M [Saprospiraceae bacterium]